MEDAQADFGIDLRYNRNISFANNNTIQMIAPVALPAKDDGALQAQNLQVRLFVSRI
jgi:hypothetical protein